MTWPLYNERLLRLLDLGLWLDYSRMDVPEGFFAKMAGPCRSAFADMKALESGCLANHDEERMVGHYWLRDPSLAPTAAIGDGYRDQIVAAKRFAGDVHSGKVKPARAERFRHVLVIGIGGSALGPQLVGDALGTEEDRMKMAYLDNTDPDGIDRVLRGLPLEETLTVVISKSGGTPETRNGMKEAEAAYAKAGLKLAQHAIAVTGPGKKLDKIAVEQGWLARFPMTADIGGRTSVMSVVGLVPMALQGLDVDALLAGAKAMDEHTRLEEPIGNAAMLLALMWHAAGEGRGAKDMVILPYKDRLQLFSKYLQQLVMESLGKELDLAGRTVHQGIAVYGNKGSTDQHAYVQQLRDGVANFFATFIEVRRGRIGESVEVEPGALEEAGSTARWPGVTSGDYLQGFLRGTRQALSEKGRGSVTISIETVNARNLGALIALYERAVGFYAFLVNINAYHQPGVEAGKEAAARFIDLLTRCRRRLSAQPLNADEMSDLLDPEVEEDLGKDHVPVSRETIYHALNHMAANDGGVLVTRGVRPNEDRFFRKL